eukprot:8957403-Pyramimonas_sp.AAC.2
MEGLAGPPLLEPAKKFFSALRQQEDYKGAGLMRTWLAGDCQERLQQVRAVHSPLCAMCGVEAGADAHRIFRCEWRALERYSWT